MRPARILFIGNFPSLENELQRHYHVISVTDLTRAQEILTMQWFHLAIIQLRSTDSGIDQRRLEFCMRDLDLIPKIVLGPGVLDEVSVVICRTLSLLESSSPALTVMMETDSIERINHTIHQAIKTSVVAGYQSRPQINGIEFHSLASALFPETTPSDWIAELEDLFMILFRGFVDATIERRDHLPYKRGAFVTFWATARSKTISKHYPLVVKCGRRSTIDHMLERYEDFLFPLTAIRPASIARTSHFGAVALPVPAGQPEHSISLIDFPEFYHNQQDTGAINDLIKHLFDKTFHHWLRETNAPDSLNDRTLGDFFVGRWELSDEKKLEDTIAELCRSSAARSIRLERTGKGLSFWMNHELSFPDPLKFLYGRSGSFTKHPFQVCITHGDFRGKNLCVDLDKNSWVEGYECMDWGPAITDVANVENMVKFHCLGAYPATKNLIHLFKLEKILLEPDEMSDSLRPDDLPQIDKAVDIIQHLRNRWGRALSGNDLQEYYAILFYFAMREVVSDNYSSKQATDIRKVHALISSAMIGYRLENWNSWKGWPGAARAARG